VFDIFGSTVGFASFLRETAPENTMQISEETRSRLGSGLYPMTRRNFSVNGKAYVTHLMRALGSSSTVILPGVS